MTKPLTYPLRLWCSDADFRVKLLGRLSGDPYRHRFCGPDLDVRDADPDSDLRLLRPERRAYSRPPPLLLSLPMAVSTSARRP